jgi:hypothetical protein
MEMSGQYNAPASLLLTEILLVPTEEDHRSGLDVLEMRKLLSY